MLTQKYSIRKDKHDHRDLHFKATLGQYPISASLQEKMSRIVDQGELGSCTANAIVSGLKEYLMLVRGEVFVELSRLFLYWHERQIEDTINEDGGAEIRDGMKVLQQIGVCQELDFPYDISTFTRTPSEKAEADAAAFKIGEYHRILDLDGVREAIVSGLPVVAGIMIYESFESAEVASNGYVPMPLPNEQCLGGHAVLIVGYDDSKEHLIVRNSWGTDWGDGGYFYLPYAYYTQGLIMDMWTGK